MALPIVVCLPLVGACASPGHTQPCPPSIKLAADDADRAIGEYRSGPPPVASRQEWLRHLARLYEAKARYTKVCRGDPKEAEKIMRNADKLRKRLDEGLR